nr:rhodanese-like domain-containing protein [uncultured Draconibacterium sp.]
MKKNIQWILSVLLVLVVLVLVRTFNPNLFKRNVNEALTSSNEMTFAVQNLSALKDNYSIVELDAENQHFPNSVMIPFDQLLEKENKEKLTSLDGKILLYSNNIATSSKAWVILNQLEFEEVYVLSDEENPEELKYKFQPDTTIRLE